MCGVWCVVGGREGALANLSLFICVCVLLLRCVWVTVYKRVCVKR